MLRLCEREGLCVSSACSLLGHSRQAFYKKRWSGDDALRTESRVLQAVRDIRSVDPGIGGYKLWLMARSMFGAGNVPGRDAFMRLLRENRLMHKPPKPRHTTNSNHRFHKWKNLISGYAPDAPNRLWVSDITYIDTDSGNCYLHLVTDAYSHKIIGWRVSASLGAVFTLEALRMAIEQTGRDDLSGLIHHSDRGVQYCCDMYTEELQRHNIRISMTEDYKPTDNAIAERVNGIIKTEYIYPQEHRFVDVKEAREKIGSFIGFYNDGRPHASIGNKTPSLVHGQSGKQKRCWKAKVYGKNRLVSDHTQTAAAPE